MIPIDFKTGFQGYLIIMLLIFGGVLVYEMWRARRSTWRLSEERLCRCPGCNHSFILRRNVSAADCPHCGRHCTVYRKNS